MKPDEYFLSFYRADVRVFAKEDVPFHGPFWMLCGRTLGRLFEPGQPEKYADPEGFLCMLWLLNLAHQGIYTYFPSSYWCWRAFCEPFPDLRACAYYHGGIFTPGHLLSFAKDPSYVPRARSFDLEDNKVRAYFYYFFDEYLGRLAHLDPTGFSPSGLLDKLRNDPASTEVLHYE